MKHIHCIEITHVMLIKYNNNLCYEDKDKLHNPCHEEKDIKLQQRY